MKFIYIENVQINGMSLHQSPKQLSVRGHVQESYGTGRKKFTTKGKILVFQGFR